MKDIMRYFEYCAYCGLVWDANIVASDIEACPMCAYIKTSDALYDTEQERDEFEQERDEAQSESQEHADELEQLEYEHEELEGRYADAEYELKEAREKITELESA